MDAVAVVARISLAAVFAVSGIAKLLDREGTRKAVAAFGLPSGSVAPVAEGLPPVEIATAILLIFGTTARAGAIAALGLLLAFIAGIAVNLAQGRRPDCHCFGQLHSAPVGPATLIRNAILAIGAGLVVFGAGADAGGSIGETIGDLDAAGVLLAAVTLAVVVAGTILSGRRGGTLIAAPPVESPPRPKGPPVGSDAPPFTLPLTSGGTIGLADLLARGRDVLLVFFSPACSPCARIAPELARWQRELPGRVTVAVATSGSTEKAATNAETYGIPELLVDEQRTVAKAFGSVGTPGAILIDARGTVASEYAAGEVAINDLLIEAFGLTDVVAAAAAGREVPHDDHDDHDHDHDHEPPAEPTGPLIDPESVDEGFVPVARGEVSFAEHEGETVLVDARTGAVHLLNQTAAVVWQCLDGSGSVGEIAADIADVFERDPAEVRKDVVEVVRRFGRQGLLEGVGTVPDEEPAPAP